MGQTELYNLHRPLSPEWHGHEKVDKAGPVRRDPQRILSKSLGRRQSITPVVGDGRNPILETIKLVSVVFSAAKKVPPCGLIYDIISYTNTKQTRRYRWVV